MCVCVCVCVASKREKIEKTRIEEHANRRGGGEVSRAKRVTYMKIQGGIDDRSNIFDKL